MLKEGSENNVVFAANDLQRRMPPLYVAARGNWETTSRLLLGHNVDVNKSASDGTKLPMMTSTMSWLLLVQLLLDHGASVSITDNVGISEDDG